MPSATDPLRHEVRIAAPPEVVFAYFTDPIRIVSWMGVSALLDPRPGGTFRVEVTLEPDADGTLLTLRHDDLGSSSPQTALATAAQLEGWVHRGVRFARGLPAKAAKA